VLEFLAKFFSKDTTSSSKNIAKERLRLVLVHDRVNISPQVLEAMREDLIKVISEYMEIDERALEVSLNQDERTVALMANIPILRLKRWTRN